MPVVFNLFVCFGIAQYLLPALCMLKEDDGAFLDVGGWN